MLIIKLSLILISVHFLLKALHFFVKKQKSLLIFLLIATHVATLLLAFIGQEILSQSIYNEALPSIFLVHVYILFRIEKYKVYKKVDSEITKLTRTIAINSRKKFDV